MISIAFAALAAVGADGSVALMPLSSLGSTEEARAAVESVLVAELQKLLGERLLTPAQVDENETVVAAIATCEGRVDCLREIAGGAGWQSFIVGTMVGLGEGRVIHLKLNQGIDPSGESRSVSESLDGGEAELVSTVRRAAVRLVAPERLLGTLRLEARQPGVHIMVDGLSLGITPLEEPELALPAGRHAVEAAREGLVPFSTIVDLAYEQTLSVDIDLPVSTVLVGGDTPFRHRWWTWAMAGAGVLAVGLGGYFNALAVEDADRIERRADRGRLLEEDRDLYESEANNWTRAVILYSVGGALAGGAGVLFTLDFVL